eukprot:g10568.t2
MGRRSKRQQSGRSAAETRWARHEDGVSKEEIAKNLERLKELKRRRGQLFTREEATAAVSCYYRLLHNKHGGELEEARRDPCSEERVRP